MAGNVSAWTPQPGPQSLLVSCKIPDAFYGGARGGGKTDGLLGDVLNRAQRHGAAFRGLIVRRTLPELAEVIRRSRELYAPTGATFHETDKRWTWPNGATLRLRYLESDADAEQYQGHQYTYLGVDEAGQFPSSAPIDKLWGTLRSPEGVPCVRRLTGNPGGPGHSWLKARYVDAGALNVHRYAPQPSRPDLTITAVFIPSKLEDNPALAKADPTYEARLAASGSAALFQAWREGLWDVPLGQFFDVWNPERHSYAGDEVTIEDWWPRWIGVDWGFAHSTAAYWCAADLFGNTYVYRELCISGRTPREVGDEIRLCSGSEAISAVYLSHDAFAQKQSVRTVADELHDGMGGLPFPTIADRDRIGGAQLVYSLLREDRLHVSRDCRRLVECIPSLIHDPDNTEDVLKVDGDDPYDGLRYALKSRQRVAKVPDVVRIASQLEPLKHDPTMQAIHARKLWAEARRGEAPVMMRRGR